MVSLHATLTAEAVLDKGSGIVNDPNGWFDDPEDLIAAIRRIVHVSLETACIVKGLPEPALAAAQAPISSSPRQHGA